MPPSVQLHQALNPGYPPHSADTQPVTTNALIVKVRSLANIADGVRGVNY